MNFKQTLLLLPLVAFASCSTSPRSASQGVDFAPGTMRLSGDFGFSTNGNGTVDGDATQLGGSFGVFVSDSIELGLGGDYESVNIPQTSTNLENTFLSVFGRYYTAPFGATRPFAELGAGFGTTSVGPLEDDLQVITGTIGFMQFVAQNLALEFGLEKSFYSFPNSNAAVDTDSWSASVGVSWFF